MVATHIKARGADFWGASSAIIHLMSQISGVEDLALTTNASRLAERAQALRSAGLQRVTISLDSLDQAASAIALAVSELIKEKAGAAIPH